MLNRATFPDHGWRLVNPKAFYVTINDKDALYTKIEDSMSEQLLQILRQTTDKDKIKVFIYFCEIENFTYISKNADMKHHLNFSRKLQGKNRKLKSKNAYRTKMAVIDRL